MVDLLFLLLIIIAAWASGSRILRWILAEDPIAGSMGRGGFLVYSSFSIALGLEALAIATLFLGLIGALYKWVLLVLLGGLFLSGFFPGVRVPPPPTTMSPPGKRNERYAHVLIVTLSILICVILGMEILSTLAPPIESDALSYHLLASKTHLEHHRIEFSTDNFFFQFPGFMECLFTFGMGLRDDRLAQMIHLLTMLVSLMGLAGFVLRKGGVGLALLTTLLILCIPVVNYNAPTGLIDVGLSCYEILAVIALFIWAGRGENRRGWVLLAGCMSGFALGIKYTAILACILNIALIAGVARRENKGVARSLGLYMFPGFLIPSFWYMKNLVKFSNPFYPLFPRAISLIGFSPVLEPHYEGWMASLDAFGVTKSLKNLLILPWIITMPSYRISLESGAISLLPLAILPGLLLVKDVPPWVKGILGYCGANLVLWFFFSTQQGRFIITPLALLSLPTAYAVIVLARHRGKTAMATFLAVILSIGTNLGVFVYKRGASSLAGMNIIPRGVYLSRVMDSYPAVRYIQHNLPKARVMVFFDPRIEYYLGKNYMACETMYPRAQCGNDFTKMSPGDLKNNLAALGVTHILVNEKEVHFYDKSQWETADMRRQILLVKMLHHEFHKVFSTQGVNLYEL